MFGHPHQQVKPLSHSAVSSSVATILKAACIQWYGRVRVILALHASPRSIRRVAPQLNNNNNNNNNNNAPSK